MQVKNKLTKCNFETSIALGCFDGIHKGHTSVIEKALDSNYLSCIFTFSNDPQNFFSSIKTPQIYSYSQKNIIFQNLGIDIVFYVPFEDVRNISSSDFISKILIEKLNAKKISCGFNYHFGKGGTSSATDLKQICEKNGIKVEIVPPIYYDGSVISSTKIRYLIKNGKLEKASELLGRPFSIVSKLENLSKNIIIQHVNKDVYIVPKDGIYKSKIRVNQNYILDGSTQVTSKSQYAILKTFLSHEIKNPFPEELEVIFLSS